MRRYLDTELAPASLVAFGLLVSLVLGILLAWRGDGRPTTLLAAWLLASIGCGVLPLWPRSMAFELRAMPWPLHVMIWPATISAIFTPALMFAFCALVPRPLMRPRTLAIALLPIVAIAGYVVLTAVSIVYYPLAATRVPLPAGLEFAGPLSYAFYFLASAALLSVSYRRLQDPNDKRRVRILGIGIANGAIGLVGLGGYFNPNVNAPPWFIYGGGLLFAVLPITFAYTTLRHRLFDIRVIVRRGLQYALARGMILAVIPLMIAALIVDAARHSDQTLQAIVAERGWLYAIIAAAATLIYFKRDDWMTVLDRRFFRERYAAQLILRDVVQDVGTSSDLGAAAQRVVGRIDSALHPVMTAVLIKPRTATAFSAVAASPSGFGVPALAAGSSIAQVVRALGTPVGFGAQGLRGVPADQPWLHTTQAELIVPIALDTAKDEAMLVLGPRRSEEPYSQEDLDLLTAIGASLRLLMGRVETTDLPTITGVHAGTRLIAGRYRIERQIGEGGMGVVYAATDETLARRVAIKVIKDQRLLGPDDLERFQREARTAASLSNPHIVTIHDYGVDEAGSPYLVMEILAGRPLRSAIKEGRIPTARALSILAGLAAGVDAAHATGVIHRDLKPENVFLVGDTHAKILDYGIAKALAATTMFTTRGVAGTPAYMSPEQASGGEASPAWDVWSLSVIAFEMLTGQHPFGGGLPVTKAIPIATLAPDLDERMASAIDRALSLDPHSRPATASLLMQGLR